MRRRDKTTPMNISVPVSLRERMDRHSDINWSATACRAFERQLQAQEVLSRFADTNVSEEEALERALKVQHVEIKSSSSGNLTSAQQASLRHLEMKMDALTKMLEVVMKEQEVLQQKPNPKH
jgi:post-segregation antitoxin (ccd killing protein)